jgi:putative sporulation protein YyaC
MFNENIARTVKLPFKVDHNEPLAAENLAERLLDLINETGGTRPVVIVCIGTDRSTGDALGPLVGSKLSARLQKEHIHIYGTLDAPVHAVNLKDTIDDINGRFEDPYVIAIDACLGQLSSVGFLTLANGPLRPGAGVNKVLPEVGHIHITGIVNVGGFMEYFVLQNTRLSIVMKMADCISDSITRALAQVEINPTKRDIKPTLADRLANIRSNLFPFN